MHIGTVHLNYTEKPKNILYEYMKPWIKNLSFQKNTCKQGHKESKDKQTKEM